MSHSVSTSFSRAERRPAPKPGRALDRIPSLARRLLRRLRKRWDRWRMDALSAYLSQAENSVDLEYRIRHWNDTERRDRMPLL